MTHYGFRPPHALGRFFGLRYSWPAAFCRAFFCRRGRRDLFLGCSFPTFIDFVAGLVAGGDTVVAAAAPSGLAPLSTTASLDFFFLSAISFSFAK